jgi:hypothetical protein
MSNSNRHGDVIHAVSGEPMVTACRMGNGGRCRPAGTAPRSRRARAMPRSAGHGAGAACGCAEHTRRESASITTCAASMPAAIAAIRCGAATPRRTSSGKGLRRRPSRFRAQKQSRRQRTAGREGPRASSAPERSAAAGPIQRPGERRQIDRPPGGLGLWCPSEERGRVHPSDPRP